MHNKGAALWGNSNFEKIMRFKHDGIDFISFSPCETYLITLKNPMYDRPGECIIWEILSGAEKRRFQVTQMDSLPFFKWSHDEKYVAKKGDGILQVYETPVRYFMNQDFHQIRIRLVFLGTAATRKKRQLAKFKERDNSQFFKLILYILGLRASVGARRGYNRL